MLLSYLACVSLMFFGFPNIIEVSCFPGLTSFIEEFLADCRAMSNGFVLSEKVTDGMYKEMAAKVSEGNCVAENMHYVKRLSCKRPIQDADCKKSIGSGYECTIKETKITTVCLNNERYVYSCYKPRSSWLGLLPDVWVRITSVQAKDCFMEEKKPQQFVTALLIPTEPKHTQVKETQKKSIADGSTNNSPLSTTLAKSTEATPLQETETQKKSITDGPTYNSPLSTTLPKSSEATPLQVTETQKKSITDGPTNNSPLSRTPPKSTEETPLQETETQKKSITDGPANNSPLSITLAKSTEATPLQETETQTKSITDASANNSPPYNDIIEFLQQHKSLICDDTPKVPNAEDQWFNYVSFGFGFLTASVLGIVISLIALPIFCCLKRKQNGYKRHFDNIDVKQTNI